MTKASPNYVSVRHVPAIIEVITPLIMEMEGGCAWRNPGHSDAKVAEIVAAQIGITITKANIRHIRDECFGPIVDRGSVGELAELRERVTELEGVMRKVMHICEKSLGLECGVGIDWTVQFPKDPPEGKVSGDCLSWLDPRGGGE